jgi:hypothetical protein
MYSCVPEEEISTEISADELRRLRAIAMFGLEDPHWALHRLVREIASREVSMAVSYGQTDDARKILDEVDEALTARRKAAAGRIKYPFQKEIAKVVKNHMKQVVAAAKKEVA